jgi:hypothetical protein
LERSRDCGSITDLVNTDSVNTDLVNTDFMNTVGGKIKKGSPEMAAHMAKMRSMRKAKGGIY